MLTRGQKRRVVKINCQWFWWQKKLKGWGIRGYVFNFPVTFVIKIEDYFVLMNYDGLVGREWNLSINFDSV